jgi:hypothetical protein
MDAPELVIIAVEINQATKLAHVETIDLVFKIVAGWHWNT